MRIYKNATDQEPPKEQTPAGETELTKEERVSIAESNDQYVTVDSTNQFPYIRFEVELQHQVEPGDQIEVNWEGHTLEGRKVTMYGFNHATNQWTAIANHIAKSEDDFTLAGELAVDDYVRNGQVDVIVQDEIPTRDKYDYTFAWVSDTQFLTELYPHIQQQQFDWIVDSIDEMNIKYLFHTGDIVNDPTAEYQWKRADEYMKLLENANLPHGVLAGNHDVGSYDWDYTTYSQYFGEARYMNQPYYGGSYKDNRGHYDLISVEGNDFIMMYMGWGIEDEDIAWMNEVLAEHPDRIAFLSFHDYMLANGNRSAIGNKLFEQVVVPNPNVVAVLSGHYTGASLKQDNLDDNGDGTPDRTVYQMLADYQGHAEGGMGFMRLLHIDQDHNQIYVNTYSPYKDEYNYYKDGRDEFIINLDLEPHVKRVATDTIQVNHLRAATIGDIQQVASGSEATQSWSDLQPNSAYAWYAIAEDAFGGRTVSDVWTFTTNEQGDLAAPTNLTALEVSSTSVKLGWDPVNTEPGQSIQYHVYQDGARMASVTDSVYDAGELTPDTRYEFYVTAEDEQGHESAPSEVVEVYTAAEVDPDAPVWGTGELTAADISTNQVTLEWPEAASNAGVEGYRIYMNQGTEPVITVTNDVYTHSVTGLDQGTRYHFTVKAYNKAGESAGLHKTITTAIDRSELTALIEAAQQKLDSTREGNAPGEYPAVARTQFRSAIALAVSVANQADATADEVESAQLALEAAIRTYAASVMPYPVDPPSTNPPAMETDFRSGNAGLKSLEIVIDGVIAALTPAFSEQITSYRLATESSSIKLRFDVAHNGAKVMLGNEVLNPDREIALKEGDNVLELVIIAENGNKKSYTLTIHRKAKEDTEGQKPEPQPVPELEDIKGHWATTAIEEALTLGIVNGYPDGSFKPDRSVTRAEFIVMMAKALQGTAMNELSSDFSDSETVGAWAKNALQWALDEGIVNGYHDNSLRPNLVVNRAEMAVMIVRYLGLTSLQSETGFRDQDQIPAWASKEITAAAENGIVNGRSGNRFAPSEVTTRAEAVMVILRMLEQVQK
ncbi:S-layer homology domain-containing protein [Paenibacillus sp. JCM 10914]|uniref:S-layer homology domain-containing protein n=1 Tax=Paenibacillus sp. JCM 10914 TaxID=1236974 RepID=UPI0003CC2E2C|nr:S-layer homology domain-containing protein [Paenibacillus sp. JCM 10914]GAE05115.1 YvnB [Paenibacillus sp. JCM 10914]